MIVKSIKFLEDYQNLLYEKELKVQEIEEELKKETDNIKNFLVTNNYPLSILSDFIEKIKEEGIQEIERKIEFYEQYIDING